MRENVAAKVKGESDEDRAARIRDKVKAEGGEMNIFGTKKDIANVILFLASKKAKFVTGANWVVDGGQTLS